MNVARGVIRNREAAKQLRDFSGLRFERGITPTDIDGFVEFGDKIFIFIEAKHGESKPPYGQRMSFERLCDAVAKTKHSLFILARHDTETMNDDIDVGACVVTEYRHRGIWRKPMSAKTVRQTIDAFLDYLKDDDFRNKKGGA